MKQRLKFSLPTLLALLVVTGTPAFGEAPKVEDILARYAEALGGAELRKLQTLKVNGTFNFNGIKLIMQFF